MLGAACAGRELHSGAAPGEAHAWACTSLGMQGQHLGLLEHVCIGRPLMRRGIVRARLRVAVALAVAVGVTVHDLSTSPNRAKPNLTLTLSPTFILHLAEDKIGGSWS